MKDRARPRAAEQMTAQFKLEKFSRADRTFRGLALMFGAPIDIYPPTIIAPGAFTKTLQEQAGRLKILWQHDPWDPIGLPTFTQTDTGLEIEGRLDAIEQGERALTQIESGTLTDLSIGFDPIRWDSVPVGEVGQKFQLTPSAVDRFAALYREDPDQTVRILREVKLWEVSLVTWGAQPAARIQMAATPFRDLPMSAQSTAWDARGARARVDEWAAGSEQRLARACLAIGGGDRYQVADVIDGRLVVVPAAVFAAARAAQADGHEAVRAHVEAYYARMGRIAPWAFGSLRDKLEAVASLPDDSEGRKPEDVALLDEAIGLLQSAKGATATPAPVKVVPVVVDQEIKADPPVTDQGMSEIDVDLAMLEVEMAMVGQ